MDEQAQEEIETMRNLLIGICAFTTIIALIILCLWLLGDVETAKYKTEQSEAIANSTIQSTVNAMDTLQDQLQNEQERSQELENVNAEIRNATDDHAAHAAGTRSLCKDYGICS